MYVIRTYFLGNTIHTKHNALVCKEQHLCCGTFKVGYSSDLTSAILVQRFGTLK